MRLGGPIDGAGKHFSGPRGRDPTRSGVPNAHACALGWRSVTWPAAPGEVFSRLSPATRRSRSCASRRDYMESPFFYGVERRAGSECAVRRVRCWSQSRRHPRRQEVTHYVVLSIGGNGLSVVSLVPLAKIEAPHDATEQAPGTQRIRWARGNRRRRLVVFGAIDPFADRRRAASHRIHGADHRGMQ